MSTLSEATRKPLGTLLPLIEVKRQAVIHALAHENHLLGAPLIGHWENHSLSNGEGIQISETQDGRVGLVAVFQPSPQGNARTVST
jgi:hypothetical protein